MRALTASPDLFNKQYEERDTQSASAATSYDYSTSIGQPAHSERRTIKAHAHSQCIVKANLIQLLLVTLSIYKIAQEKNFK